MANNPERRHFFYSMVIPFILCLFMVLSLMLEKGMEWDFHEGGIFPRQLKNIWGIFTFPFIHADWKHFFNNGLSFFILATTLYYFYDPIATKILLLTYLCSGFLLWFIGRSAFHIGASGWVYALAFFLFASGVIRKHIPLIAISLIVVFLYGSMVWHIFPHELNDPVSWEGHLSGAITGIVLAIIYRKEGPQKPVKVWEDEDENPEDENELNYFHPEDNQEHNNSF